MAEALNAGLAPEFPVLGAIGTGDLTGLAATALALIGERPWRAADGWVTRAHLPSAVADADALAFLSSNAVTLSRAVLAHQDLSGLLDAELHVAALSHLAVSGSAQPYAAAVHAAHGTTRGVHVAHDSRTRRPDVRAGTVAAPAIGSPRFGWRRNH